MIMIVIIIYARWKVGEVNQSVDNVSILLLINELKGSMFFFMNSILSLALGIN